MEEFDFAETSGIRIGITKMYSNFVIVYVASSDFKDALTRHVSIRVLSRDHSILTNTKPDDRIPLAIRARANINLPEGGIGGYLFFPYDTDAYDLEVKVETNSSIVLFPFSRTAAHIDFGDPSVVKTADAQTPSIPSDNLPPNRNVGIPGRKQLSGCESAIETHIKGDFSGWNNDETIYKMDDGSIWQQANYHYHYHYAYHPSVLIYRTQTGACHIKVDEDDDEGVDVIRIK